MASSVAAEITLVSGHGQSCDTSAIIGGMLDMYQVVVIGEMGI